jgi:hypothetical protein
MDVDFPHRAILAERSLWVDIDHDALAPKALGGTADELGVLAGSRVDRHFVTTSPQEIPDILQGPHASPHRQRHEDLLGCSLHYVYHNRTGFMARSNVQENQLVGSIPFVFCGHLDRIPGVAQVDEIRSFHHPTSIDVQAGYDSLGQHELSEDEGFDGDQNQEIPDSGPF